MSNYLCQISGKIARKPVFCVKTNLIYEKDLIENYIDLEGKCPLTGAEITKNDLYEIKNVNENSKPTDIQDKNYVFHLEEINNEITNLQAEVAELKGKLEEYKKILSVETYQYEASINVINKLIQDKEMILYQVEQFKNQIQNN